MQSHVASIYFAPTRAERLYGGPYELPAVPLGAEPVILTVSDRIQVEEGPYQLGSNGRRSKRKHLVTGETIAQCIVNEWTATGVGMTPQCRPGIWVARERMPLVKPDGTLDTDADGVALWRDATEEERAQMWQEDLLAAKLADRAYANMLFLRADGTAEEDRRLIPFISTTTRLGAQHYGLDAEWLRENAAIDVKTCPYCTKVIPAKAMKCPKCVEIVDVVAYARQEAERKAALATATKDLQRERHEMIA